jgi:hypothetical protein
LTAHAVQYWTDNYIDPPKQVALRNAIVQSKLIKQTRLVASLPPHHRRLQRSESSESAESFFGDVLKSFFDSIGPDGDIRWVEIRQRSEALT